ncbi:MAG: sugar phosphate isomerase/epimerase [Tannerella sp.]|jgi:sugar phosphate isomerase/epimerase|nr:sugar phosphate isomerase/epimerase [Tannerella sp.]
MNRRQFINRSAILLAAGSLANQSMLAAAAQQAGKRRIGIQLYSVKDELPKDFMGTLKKLSDIGYSAIEPYGFTKDDFFGHTMKELSVIAKDLGMSVSGSHIWSNIQVENPTEKEWDFWKNCAGILTSGNAKYAVQSSIPKVKSLDDLKRIVAYFNRAGEICKSGGVKFAFHNHYDEFVKVDGEIILDYLIKNTDPQLVSFQLDMGHVINGGGNCEHYLRNYPGRIPLWHASDFNATERKYTEVGKGSVPYTSLFELTKTAGLEQLTVEQETQGDIFASCKVDFDYLKQFKWTEG